MTASRRGLPKARFEFCEPSAQDVNQVEALTVAMALAPGVYARNRYFEMFEGAVFQRAQSRASKIRGLSVHLSHAGVVAELLPASSESFSAAECHRVVLRYRIAPLSLSREVHLSPMELSALRVLLAKAGLCVLPLEEGDTARVEAVLLRLLEDSKHM